MSDRLTSWKANIVAFGIFIIFIVEFSAFVCHQVWQVVGPLFHR